LFLLGFSSSIAADSTVYSGIAFSWRAFLATGAMLRFDLGAHGDQRVFFRLGVTQLL
jgi:hypothetical protein